MSEPTKTKYKYQTRTFPNNAAGQRQKLEQIQRLEGQGWELTEESLQNNQFSGVKACCWAVICLPVAFTAYKNGQILVSFRKPL